MFWKLCKHELKCSYRNFLILYAILIATALLFNPQRQGLITNIAAFGFMTMSSITFIMCLVVVIRNYNNSMFSRNSYLTHTLPVTSTQLLITKIVSAVFWIVVTLAVLAFAIFVIALRVSGFNWTMLIDGLHGCFDYLLDANTLLYLLYILVGTAESVTLVYFVMNITHTTYIPRYRAAIAIVLYVLISLIISYVFDQILLSPLHVTSDAIDSVVIRLLIGYESGYEQSASIGILIGKSCLLLMLYFFGSKYLLDHKLEVE